MRINFLLGLFFVLLVACGTQKQYVESDFMDFEFLDTLVVKASPISSSQQDTVPIELPVYHGEAKRTHDLLHTKLDLSFNWEKEYVLGVATLDIKPLFYSTSTLTLDAIGFDIHSIKIQNKDLKFKYNGRKIIITLDKEYTREEQFKIVIDYTAKPSETPTSGSFAITSDKGLFFINPRKENPHKPQQIWTQGETEHNSRWFPTIDKPNERCTQEMILTVQDRFETLSNGLLISSTKNANGTRTDYWKQELPHAPYLFMIAVGEYAKVNDKWNNMDVDYYVEKEYEPDAKAIFNHTPEMLDFFSNILDYPYPWEKYSQIVVRDFVSGAMENTTASIFGEFVQKTEQELIDRGNDKIVAHELFHHWFGDLVTCESWSNLTLNEGFANYAEYLWLEHKYGKFSAEHHRMNEQNGYVESAFSRTHPLIDYHYHDKEDMFDAHSYNKGGLVLHMLRDIVGDEAFFMSLSKYLKDNEFTAVEADELRLSFEDITGLDLNWFFNQWYFSEGHPILEVSYNYDFSKSMLNVKVEQTQDPNDHVPIFILPTEIAIYRKDGSVDKHNVTINKREQSFSIPCDDEPAVAVLDGKRYLLAEINEVFSTAQLKALYRHSPHFLDKHIALTRLRNNDRAKDIYALALNEDYHLLRDMGIDYEYQTFSSKTLDDLALNDLHSAVRKSAFIRLKDDNPDLAYTVAKQILEKEKSIPILTQAVRFVSSVDQSEGLNYAENLYSKYKNSMSISLLDLFSKGEDMKYLPYLNEALVSANIYKFFPIANYHLTLASKGNHDDIISAAKALESISVSTSENSYKKFIATNNISKLKSKLVNLMVEGTTENRSNINSAVVTLDEMIKKIIENESDEELKQKYISNLGT